jgi:hypothetical protein
MSELQEATVGYMGEVWMHDGSTLYELRQVKSFGIPNRGERERVESTHLKSEDWRREYIETFYEDSEFEVMLNSRLLSDTDAKLDAAHVAGNTRAMKVVIPQNGVPVAQITLTAKCTNYDRGEVSAEDVIEATATFLIVSIDAVAAYVAP